MTKYTIQHHTEETTCAFCGAPLYVGDKAIEHDDTTYCSETCARKDIEKEDKIYKQRWS